MSAERTPGLLHDLVHFAERIFVIYRLRPSRAEFLLDDEAKDAVLWNFIALGEVCRRLGGAFQAANPSIPWRAIIAHRDVMAHGYDVVEWARIAAVIEDDIPEVVREGRRLLAGFGAPPDRAES